MNYEKIFAERTRLMKASEIRQLLKWVSKGNVISFGGGMPDPKLFPKEEIAKITYQIISEQGEKALQYGPTEGIEIFRKEIFNFMHKENIKVKDADHIIVTSGSQQGLDILGRILIDPGDVIIIELPTYLAAINAFKIYEPKLIGIPVDEEGIKTDILEKKVAELIRNGEKIKFIYTIPTCQNPTGLSMSLDRRKHLLEIASKYDLLVVEDDPYSYFLYEPVKVTPLVTLDNEDRVLYVSTFSKILSPGLRLGWIAGEKQIIEKISIAKQSMDLCTSTLTQYIAAEALRQGVIERHIPKVREVYRKKRDTMLKALEEYMPEGCRWARPIGGMFILAWTPEKIDTKKMLLKCIKKYKVAYVPGQSFYVDGSGTNTMRLNFTYPTVEQIDKGIQYLSEAIKEELQSS
ncbi:MAG: PLP-dependent aminotransferase family protein [archaeon GB-1867-035]|nr:PLP-dependent aminotransferase family protein [Candidatus Culexmicrobium profundum]